MLNTFLSFIIQPYFLIENINFVTILAILGFIFLALISLGVIKLFKIKSENNKLSKSANLQSEEDNKAYKNFTEGHLYDSY